MQSHPCNHTQHTGSARERDGFQRLGSDILQVHKRRGLRVRVRGRVPAASAEGRGEAEHLSEVGPGKGVKIVSEIRQFNIAQSDLLLQ